MGAHFETAAHVVGTSTAKQMDEMRSRYKEDADQVHAVAQKLESFMREQQEQQGSVTSDVSHAVEDYTSRQYEALREEFEGQAKRRDADCKSLRLEFERLRSSVRDLDDCLKTQVLNARSAKNGVLSLLMEAHLMSACLDAQDDIDRKSIALFGYKTNAGAPGQETSRVSVLPQIDGGPKMTPRRKLAGTRPTCSGLADGSLWSDGSGVGDVCSPTITLDKRCLSCSGSSATVLAGFKLACLEYAPNSVEYKKVMYSRSDLIRLRADLLKQASEQLRAVE